MKTKILLLGGLVTLASGFRVFAQTTSNALPTTGNVGIGTTSPTSKLQVVGASKLCGRLTADSVALFKDTVNTENDVRVGGNLFVSGNALFNNQFRLSTLSGTGDRMLFVDPNGTLKIVSQPNSCNIVGIFPWLTGGNVIDLINAPGTNYLGTCNAVDLLIGTNNAERIRVTSAGLVGIGTGSPGYKLTVAGGEIAVDDNHGLRCATYPGNYLTFFQSGTVLAVNNHNLLNVQYQTSTGAVIIGDGSNVNTQILAANNVNALFVNGQTGQIRIGSQNLPVGPHTDYQLAVSGKLVAKSFYVTLSNWADDVFRIGYQLMPLSDVEQFVTLNKHLPGIPSEMEVVENGLDVGEMNKLLMKKVEELTLYSIGMQKQIDELKKAIQEKAETH